MFSRAALLAAFALSSFATSLHAAPVPSDLLATPEPNKLGLTLNVYRLSWQAPDQQSYQVLVASSVRKLDLDVGDLWDSGRRVSSLPLEPVEGKLIRSECLCRGKELPEGSTVWWKVRSWDRDGQVGNWSAAQKIEVPAADHAGKPVPRHTATGGVIEFIEGRIGKAVRLGEGSQIAAADYGDLRLESTTIAAWIKPERITDTWQCIYRKEDGARRLLAIGNEGPFWGLWCGFVVGGKYVELGAPYDAEKLVDGSWHHVAVTFEAARIRLYVDGEKIGEEEQPGFLSAGGNAPGFIGSDGGKREHFHGGIDDMRIYRGGLDEAEIGILASGKSEGIDDALVAHWKFDGEVRNEATGLAEIEPRRIVLVGGSLIYEMEKHGHFETAVTARWPHHDITFRNLGWPADDVFGTARGEFESARGPETWRPVGSEPGAGYGELLAQVRSAKPTTMIVGYGAEAAYAESEGQMGDFQAGYRRLIDDLETTGAKLILLTPLPQCGKGVVSGQVPERNERLKSAAEFILSLAKERDHNAIDVYGFRLNVVPFAEANYRSAIELSDHGQSQLAAALALELGLSAGINVSHERVGHVGGSNIRVEAVRSTKRGTRFALTLDQLPTVCSPIDLKGGDGLYFNSELIGHASPRFGSRQLERGPDHDQAEELRRLIIQKNKFHRAKLRPLNKTYIFLFRRHEMGHFAHEMEDYEELVEGAEEQVALLRVPQAHHFEFRTAGAWSAPREYPDEEVPKQIPVPNVKEELAAFTVADGFEVNLFAKDPMVANPINLNWDTRGRAWVSTSSTYPHPRPGEKPNDRIVILEDTDQDGAADKHTVFADGLLVPHSVLPVKGGAFVCSATELLFLADEDGDDVSESRRVVFSGFGNADVHHMIHGLRWAPWGDLHFIQSIYINTFIDTLYGPRRMNGSGVWRYRPETSRLEPFATGMVNPWGFAFDRWGQSFGTDGAAGQGPHYVFPGSAFRSAVGAHRVLKGLIDGKPNNTGGEFVSARHLPDHWQGSFLGNDFRANRTVRYELQQSGSGYHAEEVETVLHSSHRSFRPVDIKMGPDGAIYVVDWYNAIIDHGEVDFYHPLRDKSHGRIWRITAKDRPLVERPRIVGAALPELLNMLKAREDYTRNQARRELASRPCQGMIGPIRDWVKNLDRVDPEYEHHRLEALWLLMSHRAAHPDLVEAILRSPSPQARAAAARAVAIWDSRMASKIDQVKMLARAVEDEHPQVRLEAVNGLRGIGTLEAANVALRALARPTDNDLNFALELTVRNLRDQWLPAMQAGKRVFDGDPARLSYALKEVNDPRAIERLVELAMAGEIEAGDLPQAVTTIAALGNAQALETALKLASEQPQLLTALAQGAGNNSDLPANANSVVGLLSSAHTEVVAAASRLAGIWKVSEAKASLVKRVTEQDQDVRLLAPICEALAKLGAIDELIRLSSDRNSLALQATALGAWATVNPGEAARPAVALLSGLEDPTQAEILLRSFLRRDDGPAALAEALVGSTLNKEIAITAVRLAHASGREVAPLIAALNKSGDLKPLAQNLSPEERGKLLTEVAGSGDAERGRGIFQRKALACTTCHLVDNEGGQVGPDLSSVGTYAPPESLLESLLNPSTTIKQGYETTLLTRVDGTVVAGMIQRKTGNATLIRDPAGTVIAIPDGEIAKIERSPVSLMPPGLTASLRRDELIDLMRYLNSLGVAPR